ncbi:MAG: cellobiose phosphorylase [Lachnospiraceae bacterium]|nr:cellobiose phosphorylase [Lachnospiraceae bacterium]
MKKEGIRFIDKNGSFSIEGAENTGGLYFPLAGEGGLKSSVTPNLGGDAMLDQESFLFEPVSIENLHNNKNTRNFWIYTEDGSAWSASGSSAIAESVKFTGEQDKSSVTAGFMWHTIERRNAKEHLTSKITSFIPVSDNVEVMIVEIENKATVDKTVKATAALPIYGRSADNLRDHRNVTSMLHRIRTVRNGVVVKPTMSFDEKGHRINNKSYFVLGMTGEGEAPESFYPTVESFIGEGGSFAAPRAIYRQCRGVSEGAYIEGKEAVGGIAFSDTSIPSGEKRSFVIISGITENESDIDMLIEKYKTSDQAYIELKKTQAYWNKKVNVRFETGNRDFDGFMCWVTFQPFLRRLFGCSFLPYHDYGRGGRGWRDLWQDCLSLLFMEPGDVGRMIKSNFGGVRVDGTNATIIGNREGSFIADRNGIARVWMDHAFWPFMTLALYIEQTGDFEILSEEVAYFKDAQIMRGMEIDEEFSFEGDNLQKDASGRDYKGSIIEHILIENLCAFYEVGDHNTLRLRGADWNDALDMAADNGESVAFTFAYAGNLKDIASLLERYGKKTGSKEIFVMKELELLINAPEEVYFSSDEKRKLLNNYCDKGRHIVSGEKIGIDIDHLAGKLREMSDWMSEHLNKQEWISGKEGEGWFNSYYDNHSRAVEKFDDDDEKVRMMLTGQVFAIMSKTSDKERTGMITRAADHYLYKKEIGGYRLNTDFKEMKSDMGRMFGFAYGEKENGAVFSHMAVMYANALYKQGFAKEGYKVLNSLYEASSDFKVGRMYPGIPEYFNADGRGMYPYLTGAASWYLLTMISEVYGVKGLGGDLVIEPKLLKEQFNEKGKASISFVFDGKEILLTVINQDDKEYGEYHILSARLNDSRINYEDSKAVIERAEIEKLDEKNNKIVITL